MADEAASSIVVDEATAINTNAVQQLTVSDHPRVRRNSTGDDGIHYYENHDSFLLDPRFANEYHDFIILMLNYRVGGLVELSSLIVPDFPFFLPHNICLKFSLNTTPPAATATPPPQQQLQQAPTAPTYENQSNLVVPVGSDVITGHSTASESQSYASSHSHSANPSPLITSQWPMSSSSSRINGSHWPRPQVPPKPKRPDPGAIYQVRD